MSSIQACNITREFTKMLRQVVQLLELRGMKLNMYLDWLIWVTSPSQASHSARLGVVSNRLLGFFQGPAVDNSKTDITLYTDASLFE